MRASIQRQMQAGQLNPAAAPDLHKKVDEIAREINDGNTDQVTKKVGEFRDKLADLRREGKLSSTGHDDLVANLDQITGTLPKLDGR